MKRMEVLMYHLSMIKRENAQAAAREFAMKNSDRTQIIKTTEFLGNETYLVYFMSGQCVEVTNDKIQWRSE